MATHSSTLVWKIPWMEDPGRLQSIGLLRVIHDWALHFYFSLSCIGEGNGNTLQCSCLENPRDGGAWWAAVYGVAQSRTRLKWLSSSSSHIYTHTHVGDIYIYICIVVCRRYIYIYIYMYSCMQEIKKPNSQAPKLDNNNVIFCLFVYCSMLSIYFMYICLYIPPLGFLTH